MSARWGVVSTIRAPLEQIRAFVAHYLHLGAERVLVCLDDPEDAAFEPLSRLERVKVFRCDADWWGKIGKRPDRHQNRQARNAQRIYRRCGLDWLAHTDVDEFLLPSVPLGPLLAGLHPDQVMLRSEPFEALHDPALPEGPFQARAFRAPLKDERAWMAAKLLGAWSEILPSGMLSHSVGKGIFRCDVAGLSPRLHGAFIDGMRLPGPDFDARVPLLHFHAQDRRAWKAALPFRLTRGAYQYNPALQQWARDAAPEALDQFLRDTQELHPEQRDMLRSENRLIEVDLQLDQRVAALCEKQRHRQNSDA